MAITVQFFISLSFYFNVSFFSEHQNRLYKLGKFDRSAVCFGLFVFISELAVAFVDFPSLAKSWLCETSQFFLQTFILNRSYQYSFFFTIPLKILKNLVFLLKSELPKETSY